MRAELLNLPEPNWFHHGETILSLLDTYQPLMCVELGSNRGCSAIATARLIHEWGGLLVCVDRWDGNDGYVDIHTFVDNVHRAGVNDTITTIRNDSVKAAGDWTLPIDYLYVDADHTRDGCYADLEAWWPHLRVGGIVAGDDYDDVAGDPANGVTAAWDDFERTYRQNFHRTETPATSYHGRLIWGMKR